MDLDALDRKILSELIKDCRRSFKALAKRLGVHPNTVISRVRRLEQLNILKGCSARVDFERLGYGINAWVSVKLKKSKWNEEEQIKELISDSRIETAHLIAGSYDILLFVRARSREELVEVLRNLQKRTDMVVRTTTFFVLSSVKKGPFNPFAEEP